MNYIKRLSLSLVLLLSVVAVYAGGIKNATDFVAFATALNKGESVNAWRNDKGEVCLEADIDMAKVKKFQSIKSFGGTFDGQGFAIKNWKAQNGLFHELLEGGKICNLRIDASCVMKAQTKGGEYMLGWIVNLNSGTVENCESHADINHKSNYSEENIFVGGLVGVNRYVIIDCKNYGKVNSACIACTDKVAVRVGGIVGANFGKLILGSSVIRCENHGEVIFSGDAMTSRTGGIVGDANKSTIKFCINRGTVRGVSSVGDGSKLSYVEVGGIAAFTRHDIICCDNFGDVLSTGAHSANTAGIVGRPHNKLVIADCTNYGKVEASNDVPSNVGGIVANIGREVHIVSCTNRGHVRFAGMSPNSASCVGGIVANIYTPRNAKFNAYLRRCNNFGKVESLSGGNNYENNDKAIHTGGIVGRATGTNQAPVRILDCANKGEVVAATGRHGNIAGMVSITKVSGEWFDNNVAEEATPMNDGSTIFGRVTDTAGEPVAGVVVSDGENCVATDGFGYYALKSDMARTRFVYISIPDGYKIPHRKSVVQNFRRVPRYAKAAMANFTIEKRTEPTDKYTIVMIGDPQMRGLGHDGSGERYRDVVLPDVEQLRKGTTGEFFAINLGDLVYNWMAGYDDYMDISATVPYPMCHVIGNHDYDQQTILEGRLGTPYFEEYISPTYYSFNIGKVHYVMVNSIEYSRENGSKHYKSGLDDVQMKWLEEDLKFVPKDHTIYICGHAQLFKKKGTSPNGSHGKYNVNYKRYTELLKQYKRVYTWSGHYHTNHGFDYAGNDRFPGMDHIMAITVARCNGTLRSNLEIDNDGTPNGYMVVTVDGENFDWWYKTVGKDRSYQMRTYSPARTGDGYVKINIWNYTPDFWSEIEWWENGQKVATFEKSKELDPDYVALHATKLTHLKGTAAKYARPAKSDYIYRIKPSEGVRSGEIRVTDNFGVTYTEKVEW